MTGWVSGRSTRASSGRDQVDGAAHHDDANEPAVLEHRAHLVRVQALEPRPQREVGVERVLGLQADEVLDGHVRRHVRALQQQLASERGAVQRSIGEHVGRHDQILSASSQDALELRPVEEGVDALLVDIRLHLAVRGHRSAGPAGLQRVAEERGVARGVEEELVVAQHPAHRPSDGGRVGHGLVPAEAPAVVALRPAPTADGLDRLHRDLALGAHAEQLLDVSR